MSLSVPGTTPRAPGSSRRGRQVEFPVPGTRRTSPRAPRQDGRRRCPIRCQAPGRRRPGRWPGPAEGRANGAMRRGGLDEDRLLQVLVARAVLLARQRRALAGLALARRGAARGERALAVALDLVLDELVRDRERLVDRVVDARLLGDREVAADLLEEAPRRLREVAGILREALDRLLARAQHAAAGLVRADGVRMRIDRILDLHEDLTAEAVHEGVLPNGCWLPGIGSPTREAHGFETPACAPDGTGGVLPRRCPLYRP